MTTPQVVFSDRIRQWTGPLLLLIALAGITTLVQLVGGRFPARFDLVQWRFQSENLWFGAAPQFSLALVIFGTIASVAAARGAIRGASLVAILLGVSLVMVAPFFMLDFIEARRLVNFSQKSAFDAAFLRTGCCGGVLALANLWLGIAGLRVASRQGEETVRRETGHGLIVGQDN